MNFLRHMMTAKMEFSVAFSVVLLIVAPLTTAAVAVPSNQDWELWKMEHGKVYSDVVTELHRLSIWKANMAYIDRHNSVSDKHGFTLAMNSFGDLTDDEFNSVYNGYRPPPTKNPMVSPSATRLFIPTPGFVPSNDSVAVNWTEKGVVTPIKNQGDCGSCWAISAVGALEAQHRLGGGDLVSLSEQNLMDCSQGDPYDNMACLGGTMDKAFQYIIDNKGVDTRESYPYLAQTEKQCRFDPAHIGATMTHYVDVPDDELALAEACKEKGPISVAIDGAWISLRFYKSGVYYEPQCFTTELNHGVLLVGYGTEADTEADTGKEFYLVKNSWGTGWGMDGYFKMARNRNNNCGIASVASYPVV